jgi:Fe-S-cluster containining protein
MNCRIRCGACCIAPSINSPIPGMPKGKPSGVRCIQLTEDKRCKLFGKPERPHFCSGLKPSEEMCGLSSMDAYTYLIALEAATMPDRK